MSIFHGYKCLRHFKLAIPLANPDSSEYKGKKYIYIQNIADRSTCLPTWIIITVRKSLNSCIWHYRTTTKSSKIAFLRQLISGIIFNQKSEHLTPLQSFRKKWSHIYFIFPVLSNLVNQGASIMTTLDRQWTWNWLWNSFPSKHKTCV